MMQIEVKSAGITDTGKIRTENQDQFLVAEISRSMRVKSGSNSYEPDSRLFGSPLGHIFVVADGMGGHLGGSEASKFAVDFIANSILNNSSWLARIEPSSEESFIDELKSLLENAHRAIEARAKTAEGFKGMGTTLTLAYVAWPRLIIAHAGDTRCYLFRKNELHLVTRDHTVANEMLRKGQLSRDELERSHWSNVLLNALGAGAPSVFPDIYKIDLKENDSILLCSDGLNKHVSDVQINGVLSASKTPKSVCEELIMMAKQGGGSDNITIVHATFVSPSETDNLMQMFAAHPGKETLLQELAIPPSELDTHDDEATPTLAFEPKPETEPGLDAKEKDTVDFPEPGDNGDSEFFDSTK